MAVRELVGSRKQGVLCTISSKLPGHPFGSVAPYALDEAGRPIFLLSSLAVHTRNIEVEPRASLLVMADPTSTDPLASARVNLFGTVRAVDSEGVRPAYLAAHPDAEQWADFGDFAFYRLDVANIYYVGGFGDMGWVAAGDYVE